MKLTNTFLLMLLLVLSILFEGCSPGHESIPIYEVGRVVSVSNPPFNIIGGAVGFALLGPLGLVGAAISDCSVVLEFEDKWRGTFSPDGCSTIQVGDHVRVLRRYENK